MYTKARGLIKALLREKKMTVSLSDLGNKPGGNKPLSGILLPAIGIVKQKADGSWGKNLGTEISGDSKSKDAPPYSLNSAQKIDCSVFVSEKYFRHFSEKTFSAESKSRPDPLLPFASSVFVGRKRECEQNDCNGQQSCRAQP